MDTLPRRGDTKQAAALLGIAPETLETLRSRKHQPQPPYYRLGTRIVYDLDEVERFFQTQKCCKHTGHARGRYAKCNTNPRPSSD